MSKIIAIIGRPNVGKSTLFNRLIEKNYAITDGTPGVTRDRIYGISQWSGENFTVVDTGGYIDGSDDIFESEIKNQVVLAMNESDIILFMVDAKEGLTPFDEDIASLLRRQKKPIFLISNKSDNFNTTFTSNEFYKLGLGDIYPVSAISGYGTGELLDEVVKKVKTPQNTLSDNEEIEKIPKISVIGRPNVGKSSLINLLLNQPRTIVTPKAGTTRDSIDTFYNLYNKKLILTDTAGIRKRKKVNEDIEFYSVIRAIKAIENSDVSILMIDAQQGIESQDINILNLAKKRNKGIIILVNKWDLIDKDHHTITQYKKYLLEKLPGLSFIPIIFTSIVNKQRIHKALDLAIEVYNETQKKVATSALNEKLLKIIEKTPPPSYKGKYIKIKYITQLPTNSVTFAFFCNFPQYIQKQYKTFLETQIRKNFGFQGVPINIVFRKK